MTPASYTEDTLVQQTTLDTLNYESVRLWFTVIFPSPEVRLSRLPNK